mmetsp:Transcript_39765/g.127113  ORF Transcript_39765/g.127113 Transcript_39765/m.127113 type:complete len:546 (+) Transcript_39765:129-1766(+)
MAPRMLRALCALSAVLGAWCSPGALWGEATAAASKILGVALGPVGVRSEGQWYSSGDGSLQLTVESVSSGSDALGEFTCTTSLWTLQGGGMKFETTVRQYLHAVVFKQAFVDALSNTSAASRDEVISSFPSLTVGDVVGEEAARYYLTFGGNFGCPGVGDTARYCAAVGPWGGGAEDGGVVPGGIAAGVPLVLFTPDLENTLVLSPLQRPLVGSTNHDVQGQLLHCGVMGGVDSVPAGTVYETIAYVSPGGGINQAIGEWGELMRKMQPEAGQRPLEGDVSAQFLSYYTDNGAYYYYNPTLGTYHDTLLAVWKDAKKRGIPYRSLQLDSYWYHKDPEDGGVVSWQATEAAFPYGLANFTAQVGVPIVAHNRYFSSGTRYAKENGGDFNFQVDGATALPDDPAFWPALFAEAHGWGLAVYEQDWLDAATDRVAGLYTDLGLAERWLGQMGSAAQAAGVALQYCMPYPRHVLATLGVRAVTQVRASDDYQPGNAQWHIGETSVLLHALRVAPFKDTFWTAAKQPGVISFPYSCHSCHVAGRRLSPNP